MSDFLTYFGWLAVLPVAVMLFGAMVGVYFIFAPKPPPVPRGFEVMRTDPESKGRDDKHERRS